MREHAPVKTRQGTSRISVERGHRRLACPGVRARRNQPGEAIVWDVSRRVRAAKLLSARLHCSKEKEPMHQMQHMRAVVVDPSAPGRLALTEVALPQPATHETLVRVAAISLTPYEV